MSTHTGTQRIGLVGLGLVGAALTERLIGAGHSVCGFDIDEGRRDAFARLGGMSASAPRDVIAAFQHIGILSLEFHVDKLSRPLL